MSPGPTAPLTDLSVRERCLLLALMAEARPMSTSELRAQGLAPTPTERHRLAAARLVDTSHRGRSLVHELTDDGWAWCARELSGLSRPAGPRPGPAAGALRGLLAGLRRFLDRSGLPLSEVFRPDAEAAVRAAYAAAAPAPGEWVGLADLRIGVAGVPREEVDAALLRMFGTEGVHLVPEDDQKSLTPADRAAALRIGAKDVHLLAIIPPAAPAPAESRGPS
ncbi:MAG: hypothetical protein ACFCVF_13350 [Kineosporiaceae bacterium]